MKYNLKSIGKESARVVAYGALGALLANYSCEGNKFSDLELGEIDLGKGNTIENVLYVDETPWEIVNAKNGKLKTLKEIESVDYNIDKDETTTKGTLYDLVKRE